MGWPTQQTEFLRWKNYADSESAKMKCEKHFAFHSKALNKDVPILTTQ